MLGREKDNKETQALPRLCLHRELIGRFCCEGHRTWEEGVTWKSFHATLGLNFPSLTRDTEFQLYLSVP